MNSRLYGLLEKLQRVDEALGRELGRRAPDGVRILRLKALRQRARTLVRRFALRAVHA